LVAIKIWIKTESRDLKNLINQYLLHSRTWNTNQMLQVRHFTIPGQTVAHLELTADGKTFGSVQQGPGKISSTAGEACCN